MPLYQPVTPTDLSSIITSVTALQQAMAARKVRIFVPRTSLLLALGASQNFDVTDWDFPDDTYGTFLNTDSLLGGATAAIQNKTATGLRVRLTGTAALGLAAGAQAHLVAWC